jgi:hypothetical protein
VIEEGLLAAAATKDTTRCHVMDAGPRFGPSHIFTKEDVRDHLAAVVDRVNRTKGPKLRFIPGKGYGLFADRDYKRGEEVTTYGGEQVDSETDGPYVIYLNEETSIDGAYGFHPKAKGRWINDPQTSLAQTEDELKALENVNLEYDDRREVLAFRATRDIRGPGPGEDVGEELLWYYGHEYQREWLSHEESDLPGEARAPLETLVRAELGPALDQDQQGHLLWRAVPKDVRRLATMVYVMQRMHSTELSPGQDVAQLLLWAHPWPGREKGKGMAWFELKHVLDTKDMLWRLFWDHDFGMGGDPVPDWILHRQEPMPWRRCYEWSVFFRRRCLRELGWSRTVDQTRRNELFKERGYQVAPVTFYTPLPFGHPGSLSILRAWLRDAHDENNVQEHGYAGTLELSNLPMYDNPRYDVQQLEEHRVVAPFLRRNPTMALFDRIWDKLTGGLSIEEWFAEEFGPNEEDRRPATLANHLHFNYPRALWAYCVWYRVARRGGTAHSALEFERVDSQLKKALAILASLPFSPRIGSVWFVGAPIIK